MPSPLFGPGGNGDLFYAEGNKSTVQSPGWVKRFGLDAFEYEAGNGLTAGESSLRAVGAKAREHGIKMSLHAPYYISLSGVDPEKRLKSIDYIQKSLWAAELLGADTIVIHSGSAAKLSRDEAMRLSCDTLSRVAEAVGDTPIKLGIETMGKLNQLGTLAEVIEQCRVAPIFAPVVDFGHLNARAVGGAFPDCDAYRRIFDEIAVSLGDSFAQNLHCHFSKIEFTSAGEKKHLTFADTAFGPFFEPLAEAIVREDVSPRIICESDGTQPQDALFMKQTYERTRDAICGDAGFHFQIRGYLDLAGVSLPHSKVEGKNWQSLYADSSWLPQTVLGPPTQNGLPKYQIYNRHINGYALPLKSLPNPFLSERFW